MEKGTLTVWLNVCGLLLLVAGCGSKLSVSDYDSKVATGHRQILNAQYLQAVKSLEDAYNVAEKFDQDPLLARCLIVEANLRQNDLSAVSQASELLQVYPEEPRASELMGKALLAGGNYNEAERHLVLAKKLYEQPADISRTNDLLALSRYLSTYSQGNPKLAEEYLGEIKDTDLVHSVDKARREVGTEG